MAAAAFIPSVGALLRSLVTYRAVKRAANLTVRLKIDGRELVLDANDPADAEAIVQSLIDARSREIRNDSNGALGR